jgi:dihydrodipicolinate synthase/N-acetylneuraminate lyase
MPKANNPPTTLSRKALRGIWPALITPWDDDGELDEQRFTGEIQAYADTGVSGVYTGGTTGEFYAQDDATFERITRIACNRGHALGLPVQIGCTGLSTRTVKKRVRVALASDADGIQIALPFWLELKDDEVLRFVAAVAQEAGDVPLIIYHTPRAGRMLSPELVAELATSTPTFIGMKYPSVDVPTLRTILRLVPDLSIFVGEDSLLPMLKEGATGCYSSVAGLNAPLLVELYQSAAAGRYEAAEEIHQAVHRLVTQVLLPMVHDEGLWDSAVDRVMRVAGGVDVGLDCQPPYRSAGPEHVERLVAWCRLNAPILLGHQDTKG